MDSSLPHYCKKTLMKFIIYILDEASRIHKR